MAKLNPIEEAKFIEEEYRKYLKSTFKFNDSNYQTKFEEELDKTVLYKGPFISLSLPFKSAHSIRELIQMGKLSKEFEKLSQINLEQKLYVHQEETIKKIENERNVVITTGTGSGKTESFLYPILNSIFRDIESGNNKPGIRAIFLYPMNALVNDQIDRVREILKDYPEIKYGFFTGDTAEKGGDSLRSKLEEENNVKLPENELISREEIRDQLPHLLFTNYSMLEYLLIRPTDYKLFEKENLDNWKFIVLDEAHTYNGALGIEVSLLLRRLTGMAEKKPKFILTSATLGEKNKSEEDIVKFAKALTSAEYTKDDIIFSTRKYMDINNIYYNIAPSLYVDLEENIENIEKLKVIAKQYIDCTNYNDIKELIYALLIHDGNVYRLYNLLKKESKEFKDLYEKFMEYGFKRSEELVALIHLINISRENKSDKVGIYETKYHTFVRALSGAYVTLAPEKNLKLKNYYEINGLKAFELGNCRFCNASYIMGKTISSKVNGLDYLYQNNDVDIYENYDETIDISMEYYLLKDFADENVLETKDFLRYTLCSKCGNIYDTDNLNAKKCNCGKEYAVNLYKVQSQDVKNNISECPCCHHKSNLGIVRALNLGKDEATTILSQILFRAIDSNETEKIEDNRIDENFSFFSNTNEIKSENKTKNKNFKQFISFSDSRQQASFFASFFDYSYNRFIRKRLIWNELEKNNYNSIDIGTLITDLTETINKKGLFKETKKEPVKQAWITVLTELLNVDGNYGAEGLGLFYFKLKTEEILQCFTDKQLDEWNEKYGLTKENLSDMLCILFDCARRIPAINYEKSELTMKEKEDELEYRRFDNYIELRKIKNSKEKDIYSFVPVGDTTDNRQLNYIMRLLKKDRNTSIKILELIYNFFGIRAGLLEKSNNSNDEIYQINAYKYKVISYKKSNYYKCNKCGKITPYNVKGICPTKNCDGILVKFDPDEDSLLKTNYYRQQYMTKKIEPMIIKEHTAQIDRKTAKQYQRDFKNKKINILSCSTTFEMGIDIGDLETVFMRNVPPTPANYVQRAGRAGRGDNSSAFVLTFCGVNSHDYTYFDAPNKMISGIINPPKFTVTNEKIILRHLTAAAFGFFFRKYPDYYKNIGSLVFNGGIDKFYEYIETKPEDLNTYINKKVLTSDIYDKYSNFKWYKILRGNKNYAIDNFKNEIEANLSDYQKAMNEASKNEMFKDAEYYHSQIEKIQKSSIIQELSRYNVIPKYGFPVDSVNLVIYKNGKAIDKENLNRDLSIAISEYAPESEVIVDKEKLTSRYITIPKRKELTRYYYYKCPICERYNVREFYSKLDKCEYCNAPNPIQVDKYFIEPMYGFKTGQNKSSRSKKPKKTYSSEKIYLGDGKREQKIEISNMLTIETTSDDRLLVMNNKDFYMCNVCGYAEIANAGGKKYIKEHNNYRERKCENKELIRINIGHEFKTDIANIKIKELNDYSDALSFLYALLEGISITFSIERKDIDGLITKNKELGYDIILFDNVPGGAGHTKRLADKDEFIEALQTAYKKVSQNCCDENTSCYNCLRNYANQKYHKMLKRKNAKKVIENILKSIE